MIQKIKALLFVFCAIPVFIFANESFQVINPFELYNIPVPVLTTASVEQIRDSATTHNTHYDELPMTGFCAYHTASQRQAITRANQFFAYAALLQHYMPSTEPPLGMREVSHWCADNVSTRCKVFNYLKSTNIIEENGHCFLPQGSEPSPLPENFSDKFEGRGFWERHWHGEISRESFQKTFNKKLSTLRNTSKEIVAQEQRAYMRQWSNYYYTGFCDFIKTFPVYENYMLEINAQLQHDKEFAALVKQAEPLAANFITSESRSIAHKRTREKERKERELIEHNNELRHAIAQDIFVQQAAAVDECAQQWQHTNAGRYDAYQEVIASNNKQVMQSHGLTQQAQAALRKHNFDPTKYTQLYGNNLQQHLLGEIIEGVERSAQLPMSKFSNFDQTVHHATIETFETARQVNEMGDCANSAKLIDFANTLLNYFSAALEGSAQGIVTGVAGAVEGTYHMVAHPIKTVQALTSCAVKFVELAGNYINLQGPAWLYTTEQERNEYVRKQEQVAAHWQHLSDGVTRWWQTTPTREIIRQTSFAVTVIPTDVLVTHRCASLMGKFCKLAATEAVTLLKRTGEVAEVVIAGSEKIVEKVALSESVGSASPINPVTPAINFIEKTQHIAWLTDRVASKCALSAETIFQALENLENAAIEGCVATLRRAIEEFEHLPGTLDVVKKLFEHSAIPKRANRAKGCFYELVSGLKLQKMGHKILEFSYRIAPNEHDILTVTHLVECKNLYWQGCIERGGDFEKLLGQLSDLVKNAEAMNRRPILMTKYPIPSELYSLTEKILNLGIQIIEG